MVFNATFNNISVISWRSVLLVEETGGPEENHRPVGSHWQTLSHNVVLLARAGVQPTTSMIGTDCIGSCQSNYHAITDATAPIISSINHKVFKTHQSIPNICLMELSSWKPNTLLSKTRVFGEKDSHAVLRRKSKDWLTRNQDNVSGWGDMSIHGLLFQCASTIKIQLSRPHHHLIEN